VNYPATFASLGSRGFLNRFNKKVSAKNINSGR
jgi:hypothetical protein